MNRMTTTRSSKQAPLNSGTLSPNPWDLSLSGQNADAKLGGTRTEGRAPQGCDLSAVPSAEMATGGLDAEATQTPKQRPVQTLAYCGQKMVLTMGSTLYSYYGKTDSFDHRGSLFVTCTQSLDARAIVSHTKRTGGTGGLCPGDLADANNPAG